MTRQQRTMWKERMTVVLALVVLVAAWQGCAALDERAPTHGSSWVQRPNDFDAAFLSANATPPETQVLVAGL